MKSYFNVLKLRSCIKENDWFFLFTTDLISMIISTSLSSV